MAADNTHRSEIRSVSVNCRMTVKQRDELKRLAAAAGCSMQTFMLRKMFDQADLQDLPHGARSLHYGRGRKKPTRPLDLVELRVDRQLAHVDDRLRELS